MDNSLEDRCGLEGRGVFCVCGVVAYNTMTPIFGHLFRILGIAFDFNTHRVLFFGKETHFHYKNIPGFALTRACAASANDLSSGSKSVSKKWLFFNSPK